MPDTKKDSTTQPPVNSQTDERLEKDAEEMAEKAQESEIKYD